MNFLFVLVFSEHKIFEQPIPFTANTANVESRSACLPACVRVPAQYMFN